MKQSKNKHTPLDRLKHHVTGAIGRGEKQAVVAVTSKHTPGPWKLKPTDRVSHEIMNNDGVVITEMHDTEYRDAVLISAAPEMLEALEDLKARHIKSGSLLSLKELKMIDFAIAKARGNL